MFSYHHNLYKKNFFLNNNKLCFSFYTESCSSKSTVSSRKIPQMEVNAWLTFNYRKISNFKYFLISCFLTKQLQLLYMTNRLLIKDNYSFTFSTEDDLPQLPLMSWGNVNKTVWEWVILFTCCGCCCCSSCV